MAQWIKDKAPLKSGEYFVYLKHENDAPDDKPTRDSVEYIEKEGWHIGSGWAIVKWLDESESTPTTTVGGSVIEAAKKWSNEALEWGIEDNDLREAIISEKYDSFLAGAAHARQSPSVDIVEALEKANPYKFDNDSQRKLGWNEGCAKLRELIASQPPAPTVQGLDETLSLLNYIYGEAIGGKPLRADTMNRINQLTWKIRKGYQTPSNTEGQEEQEDLWDQVAGYIVTFTGSNKMEAVRVCESLKKIVSLSCVQK